MNTTRSTPEMDERFTIVGTPRREGRPGTVGVLLLNRSSRLLRRTLIQELVDKGFSEIVSVEPREHSYTVEALAQEFPQVRFLLLTRELNTGAQINLGMRHLDADRALVLWSTMEPPSGVERAVAHLKERTVIIAPQLRGERGEVLPVLQAPALQRRSLRVLSLPLRTDRSATLFPFDFVGLYDRNLFLRFDGFDEEIQNPFWQKLDFGFRTHLWGGRIFAVSTFRASYQTMPEPEDQTSDRSYARFFAKNLAIRVTTEGAQIPKLHFIAFAFRSGLGIPRSISVFRAVRRWLHLYRHRFLADPRTMVEQWSVDHV
ncbi:MAG: hypothetical protein ACOCU4_05540 [Alkalispirochaeta sp.]